MDKSVFEMGQDIRPQKGAWAPGDYIYKCCHCGKRFIGDKRAVVCAPCAYNDDEGELAAMFKRAEARQAQTED